MQAAHSAGVTVPAAIAVKKNVLVMEYVTDGKGDLATPLIYQEVTPEDYAQIIGQVTLLYQKANLVHADLFTRNRLSRSFLNSRCFTLPRLPIRAPILSLGILIECWKLILLCLLLFVVQCQRYRRFRRHAFQRTCSH